MKQISPLKLKKGCSKYLSAPTATYSGCRQHTIRDCLPLPETACLCLLLCLQEQSRAQMQHHLVVVVLLLPGLLLLLCLVPTCSHAATSTPKHTTTDAPGTCSCASPTPVPLMGVAQSPTMGTWLDGSFYSKAAPSAAQLAAASSAARAAAAATAVGSGSMSMQTAANMVAKTYNTVTTGVCSVLPKSPPGGQCGAGIGICTQASTLESAFWLSPVLSILAAWRMS